MPGSLCLSGEELEQLGSTPQQLASSVNRTSVFYRVTPKHKVIIVKVSPSRTSRDLQLTVT